VIISGSEDDRRVAVLFSHQHFPGVRFGHRFPPPSVEDIRHSTVWLKENIETGALHRMMQNQPSADEAGIIWTTWRAHQASPNAGGGRADSGGNSQ
jgi:hypothetical protein